MNVKASFPVVYSILSSLPVSSMTIGKEKETKIIFLLKYHINWNGCPGTTDFEPAVCFSDL